MSSMSMPNSAIHWSVLATVVCMPVGRPPIRPNVAPRRPRVAPAAVASRLSWSMTAGSAGSPQARLCRRPTWSKPPPAASMPTMPGYCGSTLENSASGPLPWLANSSEKCGNAQTG
jgi:hypothetical protein